MTYIIDVSRNGYKNHRVDAHAFARDLAKELGGILDATAKEWADDQKITIGDAELLVAGIDHKKRVGVRIKPLGIAWHEMNIHKPDQKTQRATVDPMARPIAAIAKDIKRRVIDASQSALKAQRDYKEHIANERDGFARCVDALKKAKPHLDIRANIENRAAQVYSGGEDHHYLNARMNTDGTITIERIGSMPLEKFARLLDLLDERM